MFYLILYLFFNYQKLFLLLKPFKRYLFNFLCVKYTAYLDTRMFQEDKTEEETIEREMNTYMKIENIPRLC